MSVDYNTLEQLIGATNAGKIFALRDGCLGDEEANGERHLYYVGKLPPGVDFDLYRNRVEERVTSALGHSGVSLDYRMVDYRGKEALRVTLRGDALIASHELDREQMKADQLLEERGNSPSP